MCVCYVMGVHVCMYSSARDWSRDSRHKANTHTHTTGRYGKWSPGADRTQCGLVRIAA